ncbi:MAG TPA: acyl-CoA carboxylase subunit epsilon [Streptosporangiaceae bacterium]|nr:acyl-CoA carboxylase subunit epsilon [Streptosporangiaceae bacterium]
MTSPEPNTAPVLSVVRGEPTEAELAAVLTVLRLATAAVSRQPRIETPAMRFSWSNKSFLLRQPIASGPGAWRRSALPR